MTGSPSWWRSASGGHPLRAVTLLLTLFGLAGCSRALVLWRWRAAPAPGDLLGLASELLVAVLAAVLLSRLGNAICVLFAAAWSLMCLVDTEMLVALRTVAHVESAGYLFDRTFLVMTLSSASPLHLVSLLAFLLLPPVLLLVLLRLVDRKVPTDPKGLRPAHLALLTVVLALVLGQELALGSDAGWRQRSFALLHLEQVGEMAARRDAPSRAPALPEDAEIVSLDMSGERAPAGGARNVLLVVLEGIPGAYVPRVAELFGVTPPIEMSGLGEIANDSMVVPNFLTHKQQTIRGLYATLCGDYPKIGGGTPKALEMLAAGERAPECLPAVLASHGYRTAFIQAAPLEYMSKSTVMPAMGFQLLRGKASFRPGEAPRPGWGPRDPDFFSQAVPMIEELDARGGPWFATLLSVGTHHPFQASPRDVERYGSQKAAAVMAADSAVAAFFAELVRRGLADDTLIVITSDESHGVPDHPHGTAWGLMLAHGPGLEPEINPGVFGSVDTTASILDYLGIPPGRQVRGRSMFRRYDGERTVLFAVGGDLAMTERKGELHVCRPRSVGALIGNRRQSDCRTYVTDSGEMFAPAYRLDPGPDHRASYDKLYRLQELLDSSVTGSGGSTRLVLAKDVATRVSGQGDFWLLGGHFFRVPPESAARVSLRVRYDSGDDRALRLEHGLVVRAGTGGLEEDLRFADFLVPAVPPGGELRLVFEAGGLAGLSQVEALVKARAETGTVTVEEYAIEFVHDPDPGTAAFELDEARLRSSLLRTEPLVEVTRVDGRRSIAAVPQYRAGRTIRLTDPREHADCTLMDGWWRTEEWASWSRERARIYLNLGEVSDDQLFAIEMVSSRRSGSDRREVELHVNGRPLVTWSVTDVTSPFTEYRAVIPAGLLHPGVNTLEIRPVGELESPADLDRSGDTRKLGVGVRTFSMRPAAHG